MKSHRSGVEEQSGHIAGASERFTTRGVAVRLFVTCWLVYALHFATNTVREIYPALSLGDHLSFDVSEYLGLHPDIFTLPGRGAFINNNPGASILGAIPYTLSRPVIDRVVAQVRRVRETQHQQPPEYASIYPLARKFYQQAFERGLDVKLGLAAGVMQAFLMAPLSALSTVLMFYILLGLTGSTRASLWLSLLYAFATPIFYRTAELNQNLLISHCAFASFALLWQPWSQAHARYPFHHLLAGLLAGWTVVLDYSGVVVVSAMGLYALVRYFATPAKARSRTALPLFAGGILFCALLLLGYQWLAFGNPFTPAQRYMPPTLYSSYGYHGMGWPQLDLLWETAFGMRFGLFTSAPILILALYVPGWFRRTRLLGAAETWLVAGFAIAFFLFCSANQYGRLQFNSGVRYIVPVTPFLFLIVAGVLLKMPRALAIAVGVVATYWSWCLAMYRDVEQGAGVFESLVHISLEGPRLPWLVTLEGLGYVHREPLTLLLLAFGTTCLWAIWTVPNWRMSSVRIF